MFFVKKGKISSFYNFFFILKRNPKGREVEGQNGGRIAGKEVSQENVVITEIEIRYFCKVVVLVR